jgi:hypothetical protein
MTIEQVTQLMQSLFSSNFQNNLSQPSSPAQVVPTAAVRQVPQSEYVTTSTAQSKLIEVIKFSNNGTSNREMLKQLNVMISECGLLSLVDGSRKQPIHTSENNYGYSPDSVRRVGADTVLIPKDDLFRHKYDCGRLFTIMFTVIQKDLLYLVNQHILDKDGLACHTAITEHVHGTTNTDIRKAKHALEGLKIYDTKTVRENIATLEEAILNVDNAQNCVMKPEDKLYYLHEKFSLDGRISVQSVMATCKAAKASYNDAVKALIELDPPVATRHKLSSLVAKRDVSKEICQNHLQGKCIHGDKCYRIHEPAKGKGSNPPPKGRYQKDGKFKQSDERHPRARAPLPLTITKDHRASVGRPNGVQTTGNPDGFSKAQLNVLRILQMSVADGWATGDPAYFAAQEPPQARAHFNMLRITGNPHARRTPVQVPLRTHLPDPNDPHREENNSIIELRIASYYGDNGNVSDIPADSRLLLYVHLLSDADNFAGRARSQPPFRDEAPLFCALGWYVTTNETLRHFSKARIDVRLGKQNIMRLIFSIGARYMNANINLANVTADVDSQQYTSFDPTRNGYVHWPNPGSYISNMRDVSSYMILFKDLGKTFELSDNLEMVRLAAFHDFMAFLAVQYRNSLIAGIKIEDARKSVVNSLKAFLRSTTHALRHPTIYILMCIAKTVMPAPPAPSPPQQQRRLSVAVMSAPPAGYMPPSSSDSSNESEDEEDEEEEEEEDDDTSTAHEAPDYDNEENYSTHSTPVKERVPTRAERANISPRRITHPGGHPRGRSPTGPSPMRAAVPERSPPGFLRSPTGVLRSPLGTFKQSPTTRIPLRGSLKRKATTPQRFIRNAVEQTPVSPLKSPRIRKTIRTPVKTPTKSTVKSTPESLDLSPAKSSADLSSSSPPYMPTSPQTSPQLESINDPVLSDDQVSLNYFQTHTAAISLMSLKKSQHKIIIDSGASTCGTGIKSQLQNIRPTSLTVSAAFGETAQPTEMGDLPPYMLPTIIINEMADTTLLSVSQACRENMCGIFTAVDCRFYTLSSILPFLKLISESGEETMRGAVENGLYVQESN